MGSGGSEAAPGRICPQYAGSLRPSEFEEQSCSALVSPLPSPPVFLRLSLMSLAPELMSMAELPRLARPRPVTLAAPPTRLSHAVTQLGLTRPRSARMPAPARSSHARGRRPDPTARDLVWGMRMKKMHDMWDPLNSMTCGTH
jgi:hypothetical protein